MERISVEQLSRIGLIDFFSSICSQPKKSKTPLLSAPEAVVPNESNVDTTATLPITIEQALLIRTGCLNNYFWVRGIFPNVTRTCHSEVWYRRDKSRYNALPCSNNCEGSNQIDRNHRFTRPIMQSYLHGRPIAGEFFFCNVFDILFFHPISAPPIQNCQIFSPSMRPLQSRSSRPFSPHIATDIFPFTTMPPALSSPTRQTSPPRLACPPVPSCPALDLQRQDLPYWHCSRTQNDLICNRWTKPPSRHSNPLNRLKLPQPTSDSKMWECSTARCDTAPNPLLQGSF